MLSGVPGGSNPGQLRAKGKPLPRSDIFFKLRLMTSFSYMQPPTLPITTTTIPAPAHWTPCRAMAFGWGGISRAEPTPASVGGKKLEDPKPPWDGKRLRKMTPPSTHAAAIPLLIKASGDPREMAVCLEGSSPWLSIPCYYPFSWPHRASGPARSEH